jgi:hypothetical protein
VCDVEVLVVGPSNRLKEVIDALGSASLRRPQLTKFKPQTLNTDIMTDYDGDKESSDSDTDYNMLPIHTM